MATSKNNGPAIYVGPALPMLGSCTVFADGVPSPHVRSMMEKSAALRELVVPVSRTTEARRAVAEKGSFLHVCAEAVLAEFKKQ